ncbi:hypothetical protein [Achromobacter phage ewik_TL4]|nr:hypothetical protein [Achromobacter phage hasilly_LB3]WNO48781.1 hypothetical protein [Achromobacter phage nyaak_TL1]WNO48974.1 hypothetical protein [Achromobacter phage ewii_LB8]WNO49244.1 hypothetical protein [Achromobacter phage ewik_TL4]WOZ53383.1 hypothetical protein [Achromobacter phage tuull]
MDRADIEDLQRVRNFICNELAMTDEMQRLVSDIELRIAIIEENIEE